LQNTKTNKSNTVALSEHPLSYQGAVAPPFVHGAVFVLRPICLWAATEKVENWSDPVAPMTMRRTLVDGLGCALYGNMSTGCFIIYGLVTALCRNAKAA